MNSHCKVCIFFWGGRGGYVWPSLHPFIFFTFVFTQVTQLKNHTKVDTLFPPSVKNKFRFPPASRDVQDSLFYSSFSFAFVRHPFVRLVSMYQDKVIDSKEYNCSIEKNYTR